MDFPQGELDRSAPQTAFPDRHHDYFDFDGDYCNFDYLDFDGDDQFDITAAMVLRVKMAVIETLWSSWGTWSDGDDHDENVHHDDYDYDIDDYGDGYGFNDYYQPCDLQELPGMRL